MKFHILVNKNSGTVLSLGEEKVTNLIQEKLSDRMHSLEMLDGPGMGQRLTELAGQAPEGVIVCGGDGSAVAAAEILAGKNIPFAVLPCGTMNLLAQDLGSAPTLEDTLARLEGFKPDKIDAGIVNGRLFLCSAVIGLVPEGAVVREEIRETASLGAITKFVGTIMRGIGGQIRQTIHLRANEADPPVALDTTALVISNNSFITDPEDSSQRFQRSTLSDGLLAVYSAAPRDIMDGLQMAFAMWQGHWQDHESIFSFATPSMIVETEEKDVLVSLDGEPVPFQNPLNFSVQPKSISVLRLELSA